MLSGCQEDISTGTKLESFRIGTEETYAFNGYIIELVWISESNDRIRIHIYKGEDFIVDRFLTITDDNCCIEQEFGKYFLEFKMVIDNKVVFNIWE